MLPGGGLAELRGGEDMAQGGTERVEGRCSLAEAQNVWRGRSATGVVGSGQRERSACTRGGKEGREGRGGCVDGEAWAEGRSQGSKKEAEKDKGKEGAPSVTGLQRQVRALEGKVQTQERRIAVLTEERGAATDERNRALQRCTVLEQLVKTLADKHERELDAVRTKHMEDTRRQIADFESRLSELSDAFDSKTRERQAAVDEAVQGCVRARTEWGEE